MLNWKQKSNYYIEARATETGDLYTVCKVSNGQGIFVYESWFNKCSINRNQSTADVAKSTCEMHHLERLNKTA